MKDLLKQELKVDDYVCFMKHGSHSSTLRLAVVTGFTAKMVKLKMVSDRNEEFKRYPADVVKLDQSVVLSYLLKEGTG